MTTKELVILLAEDDEGHAFLVQSNLAEAGIVAFIESNARYHGKTLHGRPILAPQALGDHPEPVLISSRVFQKEIADQIRHGLGCSNELILLYNV